MTKIAQILEVLRCGRLETAAAIADHLVFSRSLTGASLIKLEHQGKVKRKDRLAGPAVFGQTSICWEAVV